MPKIFVVDGLKSIAELDAQGKLVRTTPLDLPKELGGRSSPEPIRFGDWERRGIASDF